MKLIRILAVSVLVMSMVALSVSAQHVVTHEQEPNDVPEQANPVRMGSGVIGQALPGDVDYFVITTPEHLARYRVGVQIYTPHPPLQCTVTVAIRSAVGPNRVIYNSQDVDYEVNWTGLSPMYYVGISSTCNDLHYQLDFSRVHSPYRVYLPVASANYRGREGGW